MWSNGVVLFSFLSVFCAVFGKSISPHQDGRSVGPKIINGTVARIEDTRHQVSIRIKYLDEFFGAGHICGGSLIAPSMVLTAAHCIFNYRFNVMRLPSEFVVTMASISRYDNTNSTTFDVLDVFYKDTFNITSFVDDIAIMTLDGAIPEGHERIQPISINWKGVPDDSICQVTGWGITEDGFTSDLLISLDVPIVNHTLCAENYLGFVREGMICAGYLEGLKDACSGDSGGPLVCDGKLTGIVSFGAECAKPDYPGVYTDVRYHEEWIRDFIGNSGTRVSHSVGLGFALVLLMVLKLLDVV